MKKLVNGEEVELSPSTDTEVYPWKDRLMVRTPDGANSAVAVKIGDALHVSYKGHVYVVEKSRAGKAGAAASSSGELRAPMPGLIVEVFVKQGASVESGDKVFVLEAMKTQQAFTAPFAGKVDKLTAEKGKQVSDGELLATIVPNNPPA
ncbi:MAG TPA: acetyl-CoA carboxylase biotin carboxyl carrier protein subunit [Fimbriimonadaceae bacterium]|jgi:3-methylcrotonyl-CoA carboxylase alpha subunit